MFMNTEKIYENIIQEAEELSDQLIGIRRSLHSYPELGWTEMRTSSIIAGYLKSFGCDEVLVGEDVCLSEARMGLPSDEILEKHYAEAAAREGSNPEYLPFTKGGHTGVIGILHCGDGPTLSLIHI